MLLLQLGGWHRRAFFVERPLNPITQSHGLVTVPQLPACDVATVPARSVALIHNFGGNDATHSERTRNRSPPSAAICEPLRCNPNLVAGFPQAKSHCLFIVDPFALTGPDSRPRSIFLSRSNPSESIGPVGLLLALPPDRSIVACVRETRCTFRQRPSRRQVAFSSRLIQEFVT